MMTIGRCLQKGIKATQIEPHVIGNRKYEYTAVFQCSYTVFNKSIRREKMLQDLETKNNINTLLTDTIQQFRRQSNIHVCMIRIVYTLIFLAKLFGYVDIYPIAKSFDSTKRRIETAADINTPFRAAQTRLRKHCTHMGGTNGHSPFRHVVPRIGIEIL